MAVSQQNKITEDVVDLQQDMAKFGYLVERLDASVNKLTEVSSNVSQLLAVHENKLTTQELISKQLTDLLERRRVETEEKIELIHKRISSGEKEIEEKIDKQYVDILGEIKESRKEAAGQHGLLSDRIRKMEKWIWIVVGASTIIGFIFNALSNGGHITAALGLK